jgi:hypothetical protein
MGALNALLANLGITDRDLIEAVIASKFFADYGLVTATDQTTVDVMHAIKPNIAGTQLGPTVTKKVQVLWPSTGQLSIKSDVAVGDRVLLIGLRDFVRDVSGGLPSGNDVPLHYSKETMKAIPMGAFNSLAVAQIIASAAGLEFKNAAGVTMVSDMIGDPSFWAMLTALGGIFGLSFTSLKGKWH